MSSATCRFCGRPGNLRRLAPEGGLGVAGARARRMARVPVFEHEACLEAATAAHEAGELVRSAIYAAARQAAQEGRLADALALTAAAVDVLDSHYTERPDR